MAGVVAAEQSGQTAVTGAPSKPLRDTCAILEKGPRQRKDLGRNRGCAAFPRVGKAPKEPDPGRETTWRAWKWPFWGGGASLPSPVRSLAVRLHPVRDRSASGSRCVDAASRTHVIRIAAESLHARSACSR